MNSTHTPSTNARYSCLKPTWLEDKEIKARSMFPIDSESASTINASPKHTNKHGAYIRAVAFILLETSFLAFAYYCLIHPIPLQSHPDDSLGILPSLNITLTELKAGVTAASVVWHSLAGLAVRDIIAVVCSAEFMAQYYRSGDLNARISDRVSTLTSGLVDNIIHFASLSATGAFRLAFGVMAILMVVGPLGSGTVTVGTMIATTSERIQVTNLTAIHHSGLAYEQVPLMMRIEMEQNQTFKYDMRSSLSPDPVLIPWPTMSRSLPEQSTLIYQSDILHFRFECSWMTLSTVENLISPSVNNTVPVFDPTRFSSLDINNVTYFAEGASTPTHDSVDSYGILVLYNINDPDYPNNVTIVFLAKEDVPPGFNSITLSGLPHVLSLKGSNISTDIWQAACLRCYPNTRITPAVVTLAQNTLTATKLPESMKGTTAIGNISPPEELLMVDLLSSAIETSKSSKDEMFLKIRSRNSSAQSVELEPLSLKEMSASLNSYMQSAGKAFVSGNVGRPFMDPSGFVLAINQTAQVTFPVAALVSSKPFLIAFTIVIGLIVILLIALLWTIRKTELIVFNLENLTEILGSTHGQNM